MEIIGLLLAPVILIAFIWLLIVGFKKSLAWGFWLLIGPLFVILLAIFLIKLDNILSILLVSTLAYIPAISFAYKNWEQAKKPFLTYFISSVFSTLISINTLASISDNNLELLVAQTQQGQLNEESAARQMRAEIKRMEESGSLSEQDILIMKTAKNMVNQIEANIESDPDFYTKTIDQDYQRDLAKLEAQRKREESAKKLEERLNKRQTIENKPQVKQARTYPIIKKAEVKNYLGSQIILTTIQDLKHQGILKGFDEETYSVILEKERKTGKLEFKIHMSDVKMIHLFIDE